ncbi:MAG TPA: alpha/beta hydrolase [Nitrospiria bacterium]|nr:alpha/beta hydrolase [Nitrospiria bacterium]
MALDPQAAGHLHKQAALGIAPIEQITPTEARRRNEEGAAALAGPGEDVRVEDTRIAGVHVRIFEPHGAVDPPVLLYFHGGGWVIGSVQTHDRPCRALAHRVRCRVVSVEYRLAPEHCFPAAVDDCWAVTESLATQKPPLAVGGDSAGGNLAAVIAVRARDRRVPLRLQMLIYPVTDCDLDRPSYLANATGYGLTRNAMRWFWMHYMGTAPWDCPEASPLRSPDLSAVAPALVMVCEYDPLLDEGLAYAERLRNAKVPVELIKQPGMIHGFFRMGAVIDRTSTAYDQCAASLRRALE